MPYVSYSRYSGDMAKATPDIMYGLYDRVDGPVDEDDYIHEPAAQNMQLSDASWRGVFNVGGKMI